MRLADCVRSEGSSAEKRDPVFAVLSLVFTIGSLVAIFYRFSHGDVGSLAAGAIFFAVFELGISVNILLAFLAVARREPSASSIGVAGTLLWAIAFLGPMKLSEYKNNQTERLRTWGFDGRSIGDFAVQPDGKIVVFGDGVARLLHDGQRDYSFRRDYSFAHRGSSPDLWSASWPPDGRPVMLPNGDLIVSGRGKLHYLKADGSDSPHWFAAAEPNVWFSALAAQPDGKILAARRPFSGETGLMRILPDGRPDPSFHSTAAPPLDLQNLAVSVQKDGRILLAGRVQPSIQFLISSPSEFVKSECFRRLTELAADGTPDSSFRFEQTCRGKGEAIGGPSVMGVLSDGSILVALTRGQARNDPQFLLHVDGSGREVSRSRLRSALQNIPRITVIFPMDDGRILVGGQDVRRLLPGATQDPGFHIANTGPRVRKLAMQGEKILVLDAESHLHRLNGDGSVDQSFQMSVLRVYSD